MIVERIVPCTVSQVMKASKGGTGNFVINGHPVSQVTIVARVVYSCLEKMGIVMYLDDCSARIEVRMYGGNGEEESDGMTASRRAMQEGNWVRVIGIPFVEYDVNLINVIRAREAVSEIVYHRLDVVRTYLAMTSPNFSTGKDERDARKGSLEGPADGKNDSYMVEFTSVQKSLLEYMKSREESVSEGVMLEDIASHLKLECSATKTVLEELEANGYICGLADGELYLLCADIA